MGRLRKRVVIGLVTAGILVLGAAGGSGNSQSSKLDTIQTQSPAASIPVTATPLCDGTLTTNDCTLNGINYKTYIYHPAVPEKSHSETVTTYQEVVTGYCTLCNDGTYSPSCATGRGACSYHGGVAQWNAPIARRVPNYTTKTVVDVPAQAEYYEKVTE